MPMKVLDDELLRAKNRGVKIEFVTSYKRDVPFYIFYDNDFLMRHLGKQGIDIYEYTETYLHGKAMMIDDSIINIGSLNMDSYSWYGNNEFNLEISND